MQLTSSRWTHGLVPSRPRRVSRVGATDSGGGRRPVLAGVVAAGAVLALIAPAGGTLAVWSDEAAVAAGGGLTADTGDLRFTHQAAGLWLRQGLSSPEETSVSAPVGVEAGETVGRQVFYGIGVAGPGLEFQARLANWNPAGGGGNGNSAALNQWLVDNLAAPSQVFAGGQGGDAAGDVGVRFALPGAIPGEFLGAVVNLGTIDLVVEQLVGETASGWRDQVTVELGAFTLTGGRLSGCQAALRPVAAGLPLAPGFPVFAGSAVSAELSGCAFGSGVLNPPAGTVETVCTWSVGANQFPGSCESFTVPTGTPDHTPISVSVTATYRGATQAGIVAGNTINVSPRPFLSAAFDAGIAPGWTSTTSSTLCRGGTGTWRNYFTVHNVPSNARHVRVQYFFEAEGNVMLVDSNLDLWLYDGTSRLAHHRHNVGGGATTGLIYRERYINVTTAVNGRSSITIEHRTQAANSGHNQRIFPNWISFTFLDDNQNPISYLDATGNHLPRIGALATMAPGRFNQDGRDSCEINGRFRFGAGPATDYRNEVPCPRWLPFRPGGTNHLTNSCIPAFQPLSPLLPHTAFVPSFGLFDLGGAYSFDLDPEPVTDLPVDVGGQGPGSGVPGGGVTCTDTGYGDVVGDLVPGAGGSVVGGPGLGVPGGYLPGDQRPCDVVGDLGDYVPFHALPGDVGFVVPGGGLELCEEVLGADGPVWGLVGCRFVLVDEGLDLWFDLEAEEYFTRDEDGEWVVLCEEELAELLAAREEDVAVRPEPELEFEGDDTDKDSK